ncbi:ferredoxin [Streptomyces sp. N2-109]|uniref:Ferredoxin n=1 Tax=Streptomyces gossypii TaxID=2883101 RepID=A0ABT2JZG3_9ACTN|nr:ferredoxin [Streptomyces gossypii]MCT2593285.1 ferredoxin [Streptomyces gossypii]
MKINIDEEKCCGSGMCALSAPGVFDQGPDGRVVVLDPSPPTEAEHLVQVAVFNCPCEVITLDEEQ